MAAKVATRCPGCGRAKVRLLSKVRRARRTDPSRERYHKACVRVDLETRFWRNVRQGQGCWEWTGYRKAEGYGRLTVNGRSQLAHRVSWTLHHSDPGDLCVLHHCDNPPCVNPDHLYLGSQQDNVRDAVRRRRTRGPHLAGEANPYSKLTADDVREIRRRYAAGGVSKAALGREYGVARGRIGDIVRRTTWRHV